MSAQPGSLRRKENSIRPAAETIPALFEAQARRSPAAPAIVSETEAISYNELNQRANQLAWSLAQRGIGPGSLVSVFHERSIEAVMAMLAIMKAGAAYAPLDPGYPPDRIATIIEDSRPSLILAEDHLLERLPGVDAEVVRLDREAARLAEQPREDPRPSISGSSLAYVVYTSGSTGQPKGVEIVHAGACNLARAQRAVLDVGPGDRVLQFASLGFDASIWEMLMAVVHGAELCIPSPQRRSWRLRNVLEDGRITIATLVPSTLALLSPPGPSTLSRLVVTGESCPPGLARAWSRERLFFNGYGPTEATVGASMYRVPTEVPADLERVPIGRPFANVAIYVLDPQLEPVPEGAAGELFIGGAGVGLGYLHRDALTAERFLPDPFSLEEGARMYRTGDLGLVNAGGELEFLGRTDTQVKIRGVRVEPGEAETAMLAHPSVKTGVVVAEPDGSGSVQLVAFVEVNDASTTSSELRAHLLARLPEAMVPHRIAIVERLPTTPHGKIDRAALVGHPIAASNPPRLDASPQTDAARYLIVVNGDGRASVWPGGRSLPRGWRVVGEPAALEQCLAEIEGAAGAPLH